MTAYVISGPTTRTKDGNEVRTAKVADRTGTINLSVWNENSSLIAPCDVIQLLQGNTTVRGGCLTLNVGRFGQLIKIGEYVTIGCAAVLMLLSRFCFPFAETPDLSAFNEEWLTKAVSVCFIFVLTPSFSSKADGQFICTKEINGTCNHKINLCTDVCK